MKKLNREKGNLIKEILAMTDDEINNKFVQVLKKMQLILEEKNVAKSFKDIKKCQELI